MVSWVLSAEPKSKEFPLIGSQPTDVKLASPLAVQVITLIVRCQAHFIEIFLKIVTQIKKGA